MPNIWGLEDFMTVNETPVYNRANLAMFMVHVSHAVMRRCIRIGRSYMLQRQLQAWCRAE